MQDKSYIALEKSSNTWVSIDEENKPQMWDYVCLQSLKKDENGKDLDD